MPNKTIEEKIELIKKIPEFSQLSPRFADKFTTLLRVTYEAGYKEGVKDTNADMRELLKLPPHQ